MSEDQNHDDISRKIGALLNKAERTDNEHEAEAFFNAAFALMAKYQVDEFVARQAVGTADVRPEEIIKYEWHFTGSMSTVHAYFAHFVGHDGFGFRTVIRKSKTHRFLTWYGFERDIEDAKVILNSLLIQAARFARGALVEEERRRLYSMDRQAKYVFKRSFIEGFGIRVAQRIKEVRTKTFDEAEGGSLLPALLDRTKQVDVWFDDKYGKLGKARQGNQRRDYTARSQGRKAGDRADIGNKQVGGKRELGR